MILFPCIALWVVGPVKFVIPAAEASERRANSDVKNVISGSELGEEEVGGRENAIPSTLAMRFSRKWPNLIGPANPSERPVLDKSAWRSVYDPFVYPNETL